MSDNLFPRVCRDATTAGFADRRPRGRARLASRWAALWWAVATVIAMVGCSDADDEVSLQGSGATFPAPVYKRWFLEYYQHQPNARVNYSPIGSGAGIRQFTSGLVAFGASDAGMSKKEIAKLPPEYGGVLILPLTAGCIVLSYNLPGISQPVRLSRATYVKIFVREITKWNDGEIAKDNPGIELPDQDITVVTRADSSGTTYAFTSHMDAVAKTLGVNWAPGVDKSVHWKESIAGQGNDGVAALIQLTPGAIGYIEYGYAQLAHLPMAALENKSHRYVTPDQDGIAGAKALEGAIIPEDLQIRVPDPKASDAYAIVTYTWLLLRKKYRTTKEAETLKDLLRFSLDDHQQQTAQQLGYLRVPGDVVAKMKDELETIAVEN